MFLSRGLSTIVISFALTLRGWGVQAPYGTHPDVVDGTVSLPLPDTVTSATQPQSVTGRDYSVRDNEVVKFAKRKGNLNLLTRDGKVPPPGTTDARLVIGSTFGASVITNRRQFAEQRLMSTSSTINVAITEAHEVHIDDLEGLELVADAVNTDANKPVFIFQTILFSGAGYYLMQGFGPAEEKADCLEGFRRVAASFHRK